ncbi:3-hydroxybutyryl-CoA dehydrogenase [Candidatus Magnetomorum sp. HK-1]|nr:3-hydroxybutyryl-CoA dehydrogenase [Candidatus Magnetomorum sp. HK-1]
MILEDIKHILILGAGTMGQQIGFWFAGKGYDVTIYDISDDSLVNARSRMETLSKKLVTFNRMDQKSASEAFSRISFTTDAQKAAENADLINESVPEKPELKGKIFNQFHQLCKPETIFTTNTSTLMPSMFAKATGRPDKFCAFHFHDILLTSVVDIMPHPGTSPETTELVKQFAEKTELIPIVLKKENTGYVFNFMLSGLLSAALTLAQKEVAPISEVDQAWIGVMHTHAGPFAIMDSIGLDTVHSVTDYWAQKTKDKQSLANAEFLKTYIDAGKKGIKTGEGFYTYGQSMD